MTNDKFDTELRTTPTRNHGQTQHRTMDKPNTGPWTSLYTGPWIAPDTGPWTNPTQDHGHRSTQDHG